MQSGKTSDMTVGSPIRLMIRFCIPMLIGSIFQQIYNITDTLIVGNTVGSGALAAVGATSSSTFFMLALAMGLTSAISILLSQAFGAKNEALFRRTLANSIYVVVGVAILLSIIGLVGARPLMRLLGTPEDILSDAAIYLQICIGGCFGQLMYNAASAALRSVGNSRVPLFFLILSCVLNVGLDLLFVLAFGWGVMGVATATVISQFIAAGACLVYLVKAIPMFRLSRANMRVDGKTLGSILKIGLPMSLQSMLLGVGDMVVTSVINSFGTSVVAAFSTVMRVNNLVSLSFSSISHSFSVYTGQNLGARDEKRIRAGVWQTSLLVTGLSLLSTLVVFLFGESMIRAFISAGDPQLETIVEISGTMLRTYACFFPFLALIWLFNGALRGMGEIVVPMVSGFTELVLKVGLSVLLGAMFGYNGVWFAAPIGWALGMVPSVIRFYTGGWKKRIERMPARGNG